MNWEFYRSREVLAAKRKNIVKQGRGNKPNACRELTTEEEEKLFESGEFGCHSPEALQGTSVWWFFSLHFGFQARDESRKLCLGDLEQQNDPETGKEVLVLMAERGSKAWKVLTSDSSTQKYSQREQKDARSASLNFLKAIFQKKQRLQVIRFSLP